MIHYEESDGKIKFSYVSFDGTIKVVSIPISESERFQWKYAGKNDNAEPGVISHDGKPIMKVRKPYIGKYRIMEILNHNESIKAKHSVIFGNQKPKKYFMDIETQLIDGMSVDDIMKDPDDKGDYAKAEIRSVAFSCENDVWIYGFKELDAPQRESLQNMVNNYFADPTNYSPGFKPIVRKFNVHYVKFKDEEQMMKELCEVQIPQMPFISGWNFWKFDINYICRRAKQKFRMKDVIKNMSPTKSTYVLSLANKFNKEIKDKIELPNHKVIVDYMAIFEKWDTSLKLKSNMSLDNISNEVLGIKKVAYSGTLNELYDNEFLKFLWYNAVDTLLVQLIDEKCGTYDTMVTLANEGKVQIHDSMFASMIIESLFSYEFYTQTPRRILVDDRVIATGLTYAGGLVKEPKAGLFDDVAIFDFQSMFPSGMMCMNMGIDTHLGKTADKGKTYVCKDTGKILPFDMETMAYSSSGAVFSKKYESIMRRSLGSLFDGRIFAKRAGAKLDREIEYLESLKAAL